MDFYYLSHMALKEILLFKITYGHILAPCICWNSTVNTKESITKTTLVKEEKKKNSQPALCVGVT